MTQEASHEVFVYCRFKATSWGPRYHRVGTCTPNYDPEWYAKSSQIALVGAFAGSRRMSSSQVETCMPQEEPDETLVSLGLQAYVLNFQKELIRHVIPPPPNLIPSGLVSE